MQTLDFVSRLHNCLAFSQPLSCLYQAMQTRKTFSIDKKYNYYILIYLQALLLHYKYYSEPLKCL